VGTEIYCDYCGASVPIIDSAYPIIVGKNGIAKVCIHCSQKIESIIKAAKSRVVQERKDTIHLGEQYREMLEKEEQTKINEQKAAADQVSKAAAFLEVGNEEKEEGAHAGDQEDQQESPGSNEPTEAS